MSKVNITLENTDVGKLIYLCRDHIAQLTLRLNSLNKNDDHYLDEKYSIESAINDFSRIENLLLYPDHIDYDIMDNSKTSTVFSNKKREK
jgi:hypothetical protein